MTRDCSNDRPGLALASFALRRLSSVLLRIGIEQEEDSVGDDDSGRLAALGTVGLITALIIDYALASKTLEVEERAPKFLRVGTVAANPALSQTPRGDVVLGVGGTF